MWRKKIIEILCNNNIPIQKYFILYLLATNKKQFERYCEVFNIPDNYLLYLIRRGYIDEDLKVLKKGDKLLGLSQEKEVADWISDWVDLWPKGVKSGGSYVRSDAKSCLKKMQQFVRDYPEYDKELIFAATKSYVDELAIKHYAFIKVASNFIKKHSDSGLATECQNYSSEKVEGKEYFVEDV